MFRTTWAVSDGVSVALLALMCGALTAALTHAAPCNQGCTAPNGVCIGATTGSCPACAAGSCANYPGETSFSGNETRGSTTGDQDITFTSTPCQINTPCLNDGAEVAVCGIACNLGFPGGCRNCKWGDPVVVGSYSTCGLLSSCPPGF